MDVKRVTTSIMFVAFCISGCSSINQRSELVSREFLSEVSSYEAVRLNKDGSDSDTGYKNYYLEGKYVIRFWTTVRNDSRYTRRVFIEKTFLNISTGKKFSLVTDDVLKAGETVKVTGYRIYPAFFHICSSWEPVVTWDFFDKKK